MQSEREVLRVDAIEAASFLTASIAASMRACRSCRCGLMLKATSPLSCGAGRTLGPIFHLAGLCPEAVAAPLASVPERHRPFRREQCGQFAVMLDEQALPAFSFDVARLGRAAYCADRDAWGAGPVRRLCGARCSASGSRASRRSPSAAARGHQQADGGEIGFAGNKRVDDVADRHLLQFAAHPHRLAERPAIWMLKPTSLPRSSS